MDVYVKKKVKVSQDRKRCRKGCGWLCHVEGYCSLFGRDLSEGKRGQWNRCPLCIAREVLS